MPPKVKISKESIITAAVDIVRKSGAHALNARTVAQILDCSTQPIFSNFASMDDLGLEVIKSAENICRYYIEREINSGLFPAYKASGMAYIRFAKEESELFKLLYMRDRTNEAFYQPDGLSRKMEDIVQDNTGLSPEDAKLFHLEMWAFVHGIASIIATGFGDFSEELISRMLTDSYQGLRKHYLAEK